METVKRPYEFLARWNQDGALQGAHIQWRYLVDDNGTIREVLSSAEPVGVAGNDGFPLADILGDLDATALAAVNALTAERDALSSQLQAALSRVTELEQQLAACQSEDA